MLAKSEQLVIWRYDELIQINSEDAKAGDLCLLFTNEEAVRLAYTLLRFSFEDNYGDEYEYIPGRHAKITEDDS